MSIPTSRQIQQLYLAVVDLEARVTALDGGGDPPARSAGKDEDEPPKRKK